MSATATRPSLREVLLDALSDAYDYRKDATADCTACERQPTGICGDHQADHEAADEYEAARKQIEGSLADDRWTAELAVLFGTEGGETAESICQAHPDDCPNGPGPHPYYNPDGPPETWTHCACCRQPGEIESTS